jgi:thioredoxin 1
MAAEGAQEAAVLTALERSRIDEYVQQPGVAILDWRHPGNAVSMLFDQVLERASRAHEDVRFGTVDVSTDGALAREWEVGEAPTVMGYRDGILVFSHPGPLPDAAVDGLIEALWSLDMNELRKGIDGKGSRIAITFRGGGQPSFEIAGGDAPNGSGGPARGAGH